HRLAHRDAERLRRCRDQPGEVLRPGRAAQHGAVSALEPIHPDRALGQMLDVERRLGRYAGDDGDAALEEAAARDLGAAVPRGREDRIDLIGEETPQPVAARDDVTSLFFRGSRAAELAERSAALVVDVAESLLVDAKGMAVADALEELLGKGRLDPVGDDGEI